MTSGRLQMLVIRNFRDWHTAVGEVPWSSMAKTTVDCHSELVLHSLGNNKPVQVVMHQRRQTTLVFPGPCDQTCCSILNRLQLVHDLLRCGTKQSYLLNQPFPFSMKNDTHFTNTRKAEGQVNLGHCSDSVQGSANNYT